ncbi:unnamed protein product [Closterium sp. Yama58-4]|nr:unnamed protein product [Closterium sp. Yama58-4]
MRPCDHQCDRAIINATVRSSMRPCDHQCDRAIIIATVILPPLGTFVKKKVDTNAGTAIAFSSPRLTFSQTLPPRESQQEMSWQAQQQEPRASSLLVTYLPSRRRAHAPGHRYRHAQALCRHAIRYRHAPAVCRLAIRYSGALAGGGHQRLISRISCVLVHGIIVHMSLYSGGFDSAKQLLLKGHGGAAAL